MVVRLIKLTIKSLSTLIAKKSSLFSLSYLYWKNRSKIGGSLLHEKNTQTCIWDFYASPYALGDILTWNIRACVEAISSGKKSIDVCIISDSKAPSNRLQNYVTGINYHRYLLEMIPVFFFNPMLRNIHFYSHRETFESYFVAKYLQGQEVSPDLKNFTSGHIQRMALYSSHDIINRFYEENGSIPTLQIPKGIGLTVSNLLKSYNPQTFFVCVHMRQRQNDTESLASGGQDARDAKIDHWLEFFRIMENRHPEVRFMVIGRPIEWPRELYHQCNVTTIKTLGFGLPEELALVHECDMFMGTNSGPAVMAVFGHKPYLIFQVPDNASVSARLWGVELGAQQLPFARDHQLIKWEETSVEGLVTAFEGLYRAILSKRTARKT